MLIVGLIIGCFIFFAAWLGVLCCEEPELRFLLLGALVIGGVLVITCAEDETWRKRVESLSTGRVIAHSLASDKFKVLTGSDTIQIWEVKIERIK